MADERIGTVGSTTSWEYIKDDGSRVGPVDGPQIVELLARGVINANTKLIDLATRKSCKVQDVSRFRRYLEVTTHETPRVLTLGEKWNLWARLMEHHGLQRVVGAVVIVLCLLAGLILLNSLLSNPDDGAKMTGSTGAGDVRAAGADGQPSSPGVGPKSANVSNTVVELDVVAGDEPKRKELPAFDPIGPEATIGARLRIYTDKTSPSNHFHPAPFGDRDEELTFDDQWLEEAHAGGSSIRISYQPEADAGELWAGLTWQQPKDNWGVKREGLNLSAYNALIFWARGENGDEVVSEVRVGGIGMDNEVPNPDSGVASIGPFRLTDQWQRYAINLSKIDRSYISGGLSIIMLAGHNDSGITFYLDDIFFAQVEGLKEGSVPQLFPVYAYEEGRSLIHDFGPPDIMGTIEDASYDLHSKDEPHLGATCAKISYFPKEQAQDRWTGMYWQTTPGGWGKRPGGLDLTGATKLTFWMRGQKGGERIEEMGFGGIEGEYGDSAKLVIGPIILTPKWQKFSLDLKELDLSRVVGGFMWSTNSVLAPNGSVFYLDEIRFEQ